MSYGNWSNAKLCFYASNFSGATTFGTNDVLVDATTRSGVNGRSTLSAGVQRMNIPVYRTRWVREIVNKPKKVVVATRVSGGEPIYSIRNIRVRKGAKFEAVDKSLTPDIKPNRLAALINKRKDLPNFNSGNSIGQVFVSGYTRKKVRKIFKILMVPYTKKVPKRVLHHVRKAIKLPTSLYPDEQPHTLTFNSVKRTGDDQQATVTYHYRYPYDGMPIGVTEISGRIAGIHAGTDYTSFGTNEDFSDASSLYLEELRRLSLYKMANNARDGIANISNILVEHEGLKATIAEWAIGSLKTLLQGKAAVVNALRSKIGNPRAIAQTYLSFIYGLKPTIQDFSDLISELSKKARTWRKYKGTATKEWSNSYSFTSGASNVTVTRKYKLAIKNQVLITGDSTHPSISNHLNINWLEAGWEAYPFSFVADWFVPIGAYLASTDLFDGIQVVSWHETSFYQEEYIITVDHNFGLYGDYIFSGGKQVFTGKKITVNRVVLAGEPVLPPPQFKNPFSLIHSANAVALYITNLKRIHS